MPEGDVLETDHAARHIGKSTVSLVGRPVSVQVSRKDGGIGDGITTLQLIIREFLAVTAADAQDIL